LATELKRSREAPALSHAQLRDRVLLIRLTIWFAAVTGCWPAAVNDVCTTMPFGVVFCNHRGQTVKQMGLDHTHLTTDAFSPGLIIMLARMDATSP
jgi:hypothetical protein